MYNDNRGGKMVGRHEQERIFEINRSIKTGEYENAGRLAEMLELQKQHQQAEAGKQDVRFALQKRIQAVDEEIDVRVYMLYGLSPEEINIVEGRG
jgi:hypothetical protein